MDLKEQITWYKKIMRVLSEYYVDISNQMFPMCKGCSKINNCWKNYQFKDCCLVKEGECLNFSPREEVKHSEGDTDCIQHQNGNSESQ